MYNNEKPHIFVPILIQTAKDFINQLEQFNKIRKEIPPKYKNTFLKELEEVEKNIRYVLDYNNKLK